MVATTEAHMITTSSEDAADADGDNTHDGNNTHHHQQLYDADDDGGDGDDDAAHGDENPYVPFEHLLDDAIALHAEMGIQEEVNNSFIDAFSRGRAKQMPVPKPSSRS